MGTCPKCHPEINELYEGTLVISEDNILWLEVSVDQLLPVHELEGFCYLSKVDSGLGCLQAHFRLYGVEEVSAWSVVLDHNVAGLCLEGCVVGLDDVLVFAQVLAVFELLLEGGPVCGVLVDGLDGHLGVGLLVQGDPCRPVGPFACLADESEPLVEAGLVDASAG